MIRILKVTSTNHSQPFFVPQQQINGLWQEFIGYDADSPYLHPKAFDSLLKAELFLKSPSIYVEGGNCPGTSASVVKTIQSQIK